MKPRLTNRILRGLRHMSNMADQMENEDDWKHYMTRKEHKEWRDADKWVSQMIGYRKEKEREQ